MKIDGVFDIETQDWDKFVVGGLLTDRGYSESWAADKFFDAVISTRGTLAAHSGGRFDMLWLVHEAMKRGVRWSAKARGSGLLALRIGEATLIDSYALFPVSLKKLALAGGQREKSEVGLPCVCGAKCGGYCSIKVRGMPPTHRRLLSEYLRVDCESLLSAYRAVTAELESHDISLGLTVGGSAWKTVAKWCDIGSCSHDLGTYQALREGYFGGRTEVYRTRAVQGHRYDINSSYPAALSAMTLPCGRRTFIRRDAASRRFAAGAPCIVSARVHVDAGVKIAPLPLRTAARVLYPTGSFDGVWTGLELRAAESNGAHIERIHGGHFWADERPFLKPFADRIWSVRASYIDAGRKEMSQIVKWIANSATGKFAQKPTHSALEYRTHDEDAPEGGMPLSTSAHGTVWETQRTAIDACAHVELSAHLVAYARLELGAQLRVAPTPIYCDTDSVYSVEPLSRRIGSGLGEWGYEGAMTEWEALAPKLYRYDSEKGPAVKGKGMSGLDAAGFDALKAGEKWTVDRGVEGLRTGLRKNQVFSRKNSARGISLVDGWVGGRVRVDDSTRAPSVEEYFSKFA